MWYMVDAKVLPAWLPDAGDLGRSTGHEWRSRSARHLARVRRRGHTLSVPPCLLCKLGEAFAKREFRVCVDIRELLMDKLSFFLM